MPSAMSMPMPMPMPMPMHVHLPGIEGTMLGSEVVNGAYAYDYTIEQKG